MDSPRVPMAAGLAQKRANGFLFVFLAGLAVLAAYLIADLHKPALPSGPKPVTGDKPWLPEPDSRLSKKVWGYE